MQVRRQYAGMPSDVAQARKFVRETLEADADSDALDLVLVIVSELVTNAVVHARTEVTVAVGWDGDMARLEVEDGNTRTPQPCHVPVDATSGRGLQLLDEVADQWGVDRHAHGKTVWFEAALAARDGH